MHRCSDPNLGPNRLMVAAAVRVDPAFVSDRARGDNVGAWLLECTHDGDRRLTSHRWLIEDAAKRATYAHLYYDLFERHGLRVLDVGGGLCALGRRLAARHEYHLVDIGAHDGDELVREFLADAGPGFHLHALDWYELPDLGVFDVVLANDLFPNVDQRLPMFIERMMPLTRDLRLSLTYFDRWRFYRTRRLDADEILTMLAWTGRHIAQTLEPLVDDQCGILARELGRSTESAFANGRQVCIVQLVGDGVGGSSRRDAAHERPGEMD